MILIAKPTHYL